MTGFGHWNYAETFTGKEAAHLIAGLDPSLSTAETEYKIRPIVTRMKKAYYQFVRDLASAIESGAGTFAEGNRAHFVEINPCKHRKSQGHELWSVEIEDLIRTYNENYAAAGIPEDFEFCESARHTVTVEKAIQHEKKRFAEGNEESNERWRNVIYSLHSPLLDWSYDYVHEFDDQKFSRAELHRWICENSLPSEYQFKLANPTPQSLDQQEVSPKSEAAFLNIIGALCELYWNAAHPEQNYSQAALLGKLAKYEGFPGMSERNLKEKLTKAMRAIKS